MPAMMNHKTPPATPSAVDRVMVRLNVVLRPAARGAQDFLAAFRFLMIDTRLESGCLGCSAWADQDGTVHYVEEWATDVDMRRRLRSNRFTSLLAVLESAHEPPCVQFDFVTTTRGLDYVAEVRRDVIN
jgi:quinol monooxygenase YgiN